MADLIKITRDDVTLAGAIRKNGDVLPASAVSDAIRQLIKDGAVVGAELATGEASETTAGGPVVPPITMTYNPAGEPLQIRIPGPWGDTAPQTVVEVLPPVEQPQRVPAPTTEVVTTPATAATPSVLDGTVDDVAAAVATMDADDLRTLREAEAADKNRKGVLDAIDAREKALAAA
jgi:hypothetical protein